ncbi:unnamed protein product [Pleuronectes platessa]|uniref:Uncharacterized protein n=1 Tax=Pleuronectes platessa TaxID=8262 RepID=A0A9N7UGK7_PLEPL|nr:unnamed protein product [Pleuronectes platessa]
MGFLKAECEGGLGEGGGGHKARATSQAAQGEASRDPDTKSESGPSSSSSLSSVPLDVPPRLPSQLQLCSSVNWTSGLEGVRWWPHCVSTRSVWMTLTAPVLRWAREKVFVLRDKHRSKSCNIRTILCEVSAGERRFVAPGCRCNLIIIITMSLIFCFYLCTTVQTLNSSDVDDFTSTWRAVVFKYLDA